MQSTFISPAVVGTLVCVLSACGGVSQSANRASSNTRVDNPAAIAEATPPRTERHGLVVAAPADVGIPAEAIAKIRSRAKQEKTSALVILRDGKLVVEDYFDGNDQPLVAMSATKSVAALAIAHLAESGRLDLDKPLKQIFAKWDDGEFDPITVRHLLNHTSGLATERADFKDGSIVEHAMESKRVSAPGTEFRYNNNAVDLLGAVIRPITGEFIDDYLQAHIFGPMNVVGAYWMKDAVGNPRTAGELMIRPIDLAKIGQLMLNNGKWADTQILKPESVELLVAQSQQFASSSGLLWWREQEQDFTLTQALLQIWKQHGLAESAVSSAKALVDKPFSSKDEYRVALRNAIAWNDLKPLNDLFIAGKLQWVAEKPKGELLGYSARGWLGQFLVVVPSCKLVAVRMRSPNPDDYRDPTGKSQFVYDDFRKDIIKMARSMNCLR